MEEVAWVAVGVDAINWRKCMKSRSKQISKELTVATTLVLGLALTPSHAQDNNLNLIVGQSGEVRQLAQSCTSPSGWPIECQAPPPPDISSGERLVNWLKRIISNVAG